MDDRIGRLNAALSGHYRVQRELGEGGMATVYLAEDLRHERTVALKVLKPELAAVVGADRFLAEIKTTAKLQHPHILPLFDSGEADKLLFYVMPHVEGESLRDRLDRERQLPVADAVGIATSVADALLYAHDHGVVHRDIKPANILIQAGQPVVSDFGIALAVSAGGGGRLTETGLSLGTPHYMSPEQATGDQIVGPATDIWALGCVLHEMLVGEPPYTGSSPQAVLGKIITAEPPSASELRRSVPPNVDAAIRKALEKVPADRFKTAGELTRALGDAGYRHRESVGARVTATRGLWNPLSVAACGVAAVFAVTTAWSIASRPDASPDIPTRVVSMPGGGLAFAVATHLAISDDGEWLAWITNPRDGLSQLYLRRADEETERLVPDSEGARDPVFSPDGAWVAFTAEGSLKRAPVAGGPALTISDDGFFPSDWGDDGTIVGEIGGVLYGVPSVGGERETILPIDDDGRRGYTPRFLPGDDAVLFTSYLSDEDTQIRLLDLRSAETRTLVEDGSNPRYLPTGHIVYGHTDQALFAAEFDIRRREVIGDPVPILQPVLVTGLGFTQFAVSNTGTAVYQAVSGVSEAQVVLVDSTGAEEPLSIDVGLVTSPRFSPDGESISYVTGPTNVGNVFVYSLYQRTSRRMTFEGLSGYAVWSRDGEELIFASSRAGTQQYDVFHMDADLTGSAERAFSLPGQQFPSTNDADGRIVFRDAIATGWDLRLATPDGDSVVVTGLLTAAWDELEAALSPDGRWMAYVSNQDGLDEVYVTAFPAPVAPVKISQGGGGWPAWHPNGRALFYIDDHVDLVEVELRMEPSITVVGQRTVLPVTAYDRRRTVRQYDISPDGRRFVMLRVSAPGATNPGDEMIVVTNWFEELRERMER